MNLSEETRKRLSEVLSWYERSELATEHAVELAIYQATGYVWGLGDAGLPVAGDTIRGMEFGRAYGQAKREYLAEDGTRSMLSNIRSAFEEWVSTGVIARTEAERQARQVILVKSAREEMARALS